MRLQIVFRKTVYTFIVGLVVVVTGLAWPISSSQAMTLESGYVAQPGDTALDVSLFYGVEPSAFTNMNTLEANSLASGQNLALNPPVQTANIDVTKATTDTGSELSSAELPEQAADAPVERPSTYIVQPGDTLFRIAQQFGVSVHAMAVANSLPSVDSIFWGQLLAIPDEATAAQYDLQPLPQSAVAEKTVDLPELEEPLTGTGGPYDTGPGKVITVNLSTQTAYAFEDGVLLNEFVVSTGLPGTPTVTGTFSIYLKLDSQHMVGPDYDLPGVPWVMYFYQGYGLHGTYWHNNFGHPMSHGCVNMKTPEAEWLYGWAPLGTPVVVSY
jgi:lipoprotein-anchoring transpeptidase ErfK/SrfK